MTANQLTQPPLPAVVPTPALLKQNLEAMPPAREAVLRELLPYDYDHALRSGLIRQFYYNPRTGEDGLLHTLAGDTVVGPDGSMVPRGFHHEPSAAAVWPTVQTADGRSVVSTRVEGEHVAHPFEPFAARIVVDGLRKFGLVKDPKTGETSLMEAKNGMFPREYDALAVMKAIVIARQTRDRSQDAPASRPKNVVNTSSAPMIDGQTPMRIRLVLDRQTDKIVTAFPVGASRRSPRFDSDRLHSYVYGDAGLVRTRSDARG